MRRLPRPRTSTLGGFRVCALSAALVAPLSLWAQSSVGTTVPAAPSAAPPSPTGAPPAAMQAGVLKSVQGEVRLLRADGRTEIAQPGDGVSQVDRIQTGAHSGASLRLRDGTVLVVGPQSQLDLKQYQFNATTHDGNILLSLLQGSMRMVSGLIAKKQPEAVRIDTQTATIGIRGTDFIVSTDAHP